MKITESNTKCCTIVPPIVFRALTIVAVLCVVMSNMPQARAAGTFTTYAGTGPVTSMDSYGSTLWCGTEFGLVKWDTTDMTYDIFRVPDGLPHADIKDVDVASNGDVWVATAENGLARFDGTSWKAYGIADNQFHYPNGLSVHAADNGMVYAGMYLPNEYDIGGGLARFDGESWTMTRYGPDIYNAKCFVYDIATDAAGVVWTANDRWLASVVDTTWTFYDTYAFHIQFDAGGTLWIHTDKGISRLNDGAFEAYVLPDEYNWRDIIALGAPADGGVLILTKYGGLLGVKSDGAVTVLTAEETDARFTAMTVDGTGTVWAGLSDGGIAQYANGGWTEFPLDEPQLGGAVYRLCIDREDIPWMMTDNGIYRYIGRKWERIVSAEETPEYGYDPDCNMFFDTDGRLWVLGYYGNHKNIRYLYNGRFVADKAIDIYEGVYLAVPDINNGLWVRFAAQQNLFRYENGKLTEIQRPADCTYGSNPIAIDPDGGVWCNTYDDYDQKIYRYFNGVWEPHQEVFTSAYESFVTGVVFDQDGLTCISVTKNWGDTHYPRLVSHIVQKKKDAELFGLDITLESSSKVHCVDKEGRLWISLPSGVLVHDDTQDIRLTEADGLPDNRVYDIVMDSGNGFWIATAKGVVRYVTETTGVETVAAAPVAFDAVSAFPNPFNPATTISFTLPRSGTVTASVYSITGQKVRTFASGAMSAGTHHVVWDGQDDNGSPAASGIYCIRVEARMFRASGKVTLIR